MVSELEKVAVGPVRLPAQLPVPAHLVRPLLDTLVVLDDVDPARTAPRARCRFRAAAATRRHARNQWVALPYGGPQRIVITGFTTAAEQGLKPRDGTRLAPPGRAARCFKRSAV